ncbi:fibronectin type III domain-containing protein [Paenibacillus hubeiensis]|uniref:fibronectin type III domain-containing protein n=1 Tax=Paenibacillus hubeiensis TaxID=3077330 RepID=UPI0031BBB2B9
MLAAFLIVAILPTSNVFAANSGYGTDSLLFGKTLGFNSWTTDKLTDGSDETGEIIYGRVNSYTPKYGFPTTSDLPRVAQAYIRADAAVNTALGVRITFADDTVVDYSVTVSSTGIQDYFIPIPSTKRVKSVIFWAEPFTPVYEVDLKGILDPDTTPPAAPTGLTGVSGDTKVTLNWNANSESDLDHYVVYVDGVAKATVRTNRATITDLVNGKEYAFRVTAVDTSGNESAKSAEIKKTPVGPPPPDTTPPGVPTLNGKPGKKQAVLDWTKPGDADLAGYYLYQDGTKINTLSATNTVVNGLENGKQYKFQVSAFDTSGNESAKSNTVTVTPADRIDVVLIPNGDSIVVQITGGSPPYHIDWGAAQKTISDTQYVIANLSYGTDYTVTITDAGGLTYTQTVNTGTEKGFIPPTFPNPQEMFQRLLDVFGTAGTIGMAIIGGALALGILVVLARWAWILLKGWLAKSR